MVYWLWAFSFPYDYRFLPLPEDPSGITFIGYWIIWLGVGGLLVIPFGEWMNKSKK
ncbi:hypothetical protein OAF05_01555 [bacterium]|nr:hypothetical protein [bacterium]